MSYNYPHNNHPPPQPPYPDTTVYYAAPMVTYHQPQPPAPNYTYSYYFSKTTSISLGVLQIIMACVSVIGGIMAIVYSASMYYVGVGFWCGAFYFLAGTMAIAAGQNPTNSMISTNALLSGLDIAFGITQVTIAAVGVSNDVWCYNYDCVTLKSAAVAANCLMVATGSWQIIFGIWLFAVSCRAIYSRSDAQIATGTVHYAAQRQETVFLPQPPQPVAYYQQPPRYPEASNQQPMYTTNHQTQPVPVKGQPHYY